MATGVYVSPNYNYAAAVKDSLPNLHNVWTYECDFAPSSGAAVQHGRSEGKYIRYIIVTLYCTVLYCRMEAVEWPVEWVSSIYM